MAEQFKRLLDTLMVGSIILMFLGIGGLSVGFWALSNRVPPTIPPEWFEADVKQLQYDVRKLEEEELKGLQNTVDELQDEVARLKGQIDADR